ncbi:MAG: glycosyltransferase [Thermoflavifilum sp.]|nr:glycosyltransferase [Thermoflavifilum sp.]
MKPLIVISAQRFFRGGTVEAVRLCLQALSAAVGEKYFIRALVYRPEDYPILPQVEYVAFPQSRKGWWRRLYAEYVLFPRLARRWKPVIWLSLQDSTPPVDVPYRAVYFHHPLVCTSLPSSIWWQQPRLWGLKMLYLFVYLRHIHTNDAIIVQQHQLREKLIERYHLPPEKVWVIPLVHRQYPSTCSASPASPTYRFFYPSYPYAYKNHLLLFQAVQILVNRGVSGFEIICTCGRKENGYIRKLIRRFSQSLPLRFTGVLPHQEVMNWYTQSHALVYPSLAETWGLPLSEAASLGKPILAVDLPYARETLTGYNRVCWLPPDDAESWANAMQTMIDGHTCDRPLTRETKFVQSSQIDWARWLQQALQQLSE